MNGAQNSTCSGTGGNRRKPTGPESVNVHPGSRWVSWMRVVIFTALLSVASTMMLTTYMYGRSQDSTAFGRFHEIPPEMAKQFQQVRERFPLTQPGIRRREASQTDTTNEIAEEMIPQSSPPPPEPETQNDPSSQQTSKRGEMFDCRDSYGLENWRRILASHQEASKGVEKSYEVFSLIPPAHGGSENEKQCFAYGSLLLPNASQITRKDWVAIVRIQKTASKTVTAVFLWLMADTYGKPGGLSARTLCNANWFGTSTVPTVVDLESARRSMPGDKLLMDPYTQRVQFAKKHVTPTSDYFQAVENSVEKSAVLDNEWLRSAKVMYAFKGLNKPHIDRAPDQVVPFFDYEVVKPWYKGAPLEEYQVRRHKEVSQGCSGFDAPQKITPNSNRCNYLFQQHMHIGDVLGSLWEMMAVPVDKVRIISSFRHPVRRTLSEYKHLALQGQSVWDFCHHSSFSNLRVKWRSSNAKENFRNFMLHEYHAFGMRNRQVKMLTGLVTEPSIPSLEQSRSIYKHLHRNVMDATGLNTFAPNVSMSVKDEDPYIRWAWAALRQAQFQALNSSAMLLMERLPESIAVLLYAFDWRPRVTIPDILRRYPSMRVSEDPFLFDEWQDIQYSYDPEADTLNKDRMKLNPRNYLFEGNNLDKSVHVPSTGTDIPEMQPSTADSSHVTKGELIGQVKAPDSRAWQRLLQVSKAMSEQLTDREKVDKEKIPFEVDSDIFNDILAVNHLDAALFYWADKLLSARVALVKRKLAEMEETKRKSDSV